MTATQTEASEAIRRAGGVVFRHVIGDGLALRVLLPHDLPALWAVIERNQPALRRWFANVPGFESEEQLRADYPEWMQRTGKDEGYSLGVEVDGEVRGVIWHGKFNRLHQWCEIGYWLDEAVQGRGVMTRACRRFVDFSFRELGMHRVDIHASHHNGRSQAVPQRLGFTREGVKRQLWQLPDGRHDCVMYGLLADEWEAEDREPLRFAHRVDDTLSLALWEPRHADDLFAAIDADREHLRAWLDWPDKVQSIEDERRVLAGHWSKLAAGELPGVAIVDAGRPAGAAGLHPLPRFKGTAEIGYWLTQAGQGKGLMTRAVAALLDHAFGPAGFHRVEIRCEPANTRSCGVPERLGFTLEGTQRQLCEYDGRWIDHRVYAMLAEQWKRR